MTFAVLLAPGGAGAFDRNEMKDQCTQYKTKTIRNECCDRLHESCVSKCDKGDGGVHSGLHCRDDCKRQVNVCRGVGEFELPAPPGNTAPTPGQPGATQPPPGKRPRPTLPAQEAAKP